MSNYIKLFENHSGYTAFTQTEEFVKPNVSHCIEENHVHYNPILPILVVIYNVSDASQATRLYQYTSWKKGTDMFDGVKIDDVEVSVATLDAANGEYQMSIGEHTVEYTLKNQSVIEDFFTYCESITRVTVPKEITAMYSTFDGCSGLTSVTFENGSRLTSIGDGVFGGCAFSSIELPNGLVEINTKSFFWVENLSNITLPNTVTTIGYQDFYGCSSLTNITLPNSIHIIGDGAFANCSGLTNVTIGSGVTSIESIAFRWCENLESVIILASTPPTLGASAFESNKSGRKIYVPSGSVAAYKAAEGWSVYANDIEAIPSE